VESTRSEHRVGRLDEVFQEYREFVATETSGGVAWAYRGREPMRHL